MARLLFSTVIFLGLVALDTAAVILAVGAVGVVTPGALSTALVLHGLVAVLAAVAPYLVPGNRKRGGRLTLSLLALCLATLAPVIGVVVVAWLASLPGRARLDPHPWPGINLGNPALDRERRRALTSPPDPLTLRQLLDRNAAPLFAAVIPRLRQTGNRPAVDGLRHLRDLPGARTQLYAQSALTSLIENRETKLDALRQATAGASNSGDVEPSLARWERLGSALLAHADSGLVDADTAPGLVTEASQAYAAGLALAPEDPACLHGLARCRLALGEVDSIPELLGRLHALPGAQQLADELEFRYLVHRGRWREATEGARRMLSPGPPPPRIPPESITFWVGPRPRVATP